MTTKNLTNLDEILAMQRRLDELVVNTVTERDEALQAEERRLEAERARIQRDHEAATNNALIAARLRQQHRDDQFAGVDAESQIVREERDQMAFIREGTPLPAPAAAAPVQVPPIIPATPVPPTPAPTQVITTPPPPPVAVQRSQYHPRKWVLIAWVFAIIGLVIAWIITGQNWDKPFYDSWGSFFIWLGSSVVGFGVGGLAGQYIAIQLGDTQASAQVAQPVAVVVTNPAQQRSVPPPPPAV